MKKVILSMALALAAPLAWAQVSETTTTTTTTEGSGTITEFTPGSTIVLKETAGPKHYRFGKKVVYVTRIGTAKITPTIPHIQPQNVSEIRMITGFKVRDRPITHGVMKFPSSAPQAR